MAQRQEPVTASPPHDPSVQTSPGWDALAPKSSPVGLSAVIKEQRTLRRPSWLRPQSGFPAAGPTAPAPEAPEVALWCLDGGALLGGCPLRRLLPAEAGTQLTKWGTVTLQSDHSTVCIETSHLFWV